MGRRRYSVLVIDGGGIRGIIPATVIDAIEARVRRPAHQLFDMIAGTSTGGIIALGLSSPGAAPGTAAFTARDLVELYLQHGDKLFPNSTMLKLRSGLGLLRPRYPYRPLEELLRSRFGDTRLSQALVEVVIPSYDLSRPGPFFFKRSYAENPEYDIAMWQVARATSAAPTYFDAAHVPAFTDEGEHALVDGGVFANNPSVAAYSDAVLRWGDDAEIHVVSIGTGAPTRPRSGGIPIPYARARGWGLARWARPMLDVVFDGIEKAVEYQMDRLCNAHEPLHFQRLQSPLPTASRAMDDASAANLAALQADAATLLRDGQAILDGICSMLETVAADRDGLTSAAPSAPPPPPAPAPA